MSHEVSFVADLFFVNQILTRSPEKNIIESFRKGGGQVLVSRLTGDVIRLDTLAIDGGLGRNPATF